MFFFLPASGPLNVWELLKVAILGAGLATVTVLFFIFFIAAIIFATAGVLQVCRWVFNIT